LSKVYPGSFFQRPTTALDNVSCKFSTDSITALVGLSKSGKSTLAKVLSRIEDVSGGQVQYALQPSGIAYVTDQFHSSYNEMISVKETFEQQCNNAEMWLSFAAEQLEVQGESQWMSLQTSKR
jgi:ABC-type oligopeptide transport system ATPase subunit